MQTGETGASSAYEWISYHLATRPNLIAEAYKRDAEVDRMIDK